MLTHGRQLCAHCLAALSQQVYAQTDYERQRDLAERKFASTQKLPATLRPTTEEIETRARMSSRNEGGKRMSRVYASSGANATPAL